jgi:hypothetical protein
MVFAKSALAAAKHALVIASIQNLAGKSTLADNIITGNVGHLERKKEGKQGNKTKERRMCLG